MQIDATAGGVAGEISGAGENRCKTGADTVGASEINGASGESRRAGVDNRARGFEDDGATGVGVIRVEGDALTGAGGGETNGLTSLSGDISDGGDSSVVAEIDATGGRGS